MSDHLVFVDLGLTVIPFCLSELCISVLQSNTSADESGPLRTQQDLGSCLGGGVGDDGLRSFLSELGEPVAVEVGKATGSGDEVTGVAGKDFEAGKTIGIDEVTRPAGEDVEAGKATGIDEEVTRTAGEDVEGVRVTGSEEEVSGFTEEGVEA